MKSLFLSILTILLFEGTTVGQLCDDWSDPKLVGNLDHKILTEASGLDVSSKNENRLYHINDSGNGYFFHTTNIMGQETKSIKINDYKTSRYDFEDISVGPCSWNTCLFIGDIGDNLKSRDTINVLVIKEQMYYGKALIPNKILKLRYPDLPHDAEAIAIHPNGDLFIITKEANYKRMLQFPARIYKLERPEWVNNKEEILTLKLVAEIDFKILNKDDQFFFHNIVTAFDISNDGNKFIILTYNNAFEFNIDLSKANSDSFKTLEKEKDYKIVKLNKLPQQEGIAYLSDYKSFIYNTEYSEDKPQGLYKVECVQ